MPRKEYTPEQIYYHDDRRDEYYGETDIDDSGEAPKLKIPKSKSFASRFFAPVRSSVQNYFKEKLLASTALKEKEKEKQKKGFWEIEHPAQLIPAAKAGKTISGIIRSNIRRR